MIANIDGDLVAYPCAASCDENDPLDVALYRCDKLMREILEMVDCEEYNLFLSGPSNFRKIVNPQYKANRTSPPPKWLQECKEYLVTEWKAQLKEYYEADDLLGIYQREDTVLCSYDKDLLMIPGKHFNWKKQQYGDLTIINYSDGLQHFYAQMMIGDKTDNVIGIAGIGPVKANKALSQCDCEQDMFDYVFDKYDDPERFLMNGICLWMCREEGVSWAQHLNDSGLILPNTLKPVLEATLESMSYFTKIT